MSNWDNYQSKVEADRSYVGEPSVSSGQVYSPQFRVVNQVAHNDRTEAIQETYRLLAVGVFMAMVGGYIGVNSIPILKFFLSLPGIIVGFMALNFLPGMMLNSARNNPKMALGLLAFHGTTAGLILSPLLYLAMLKGGMGSETPNLIHSALIITASVFLGISGYVYKSGQRFQFATGVMHVMFWSIMGGIVGNMFFQSSTFGSMLNVGVGIFGGIGLLYSTSEVLNDPDYRDPVLGALSIFAGLFNIFSAVLRLLMGGGRRD
jgi:modulator of FtsH protease